MLASASTSRYPDRDTPDRGEIEGLIGLVQYTIPAAAAREAWQTRRCIQEQVVRAVTTLGGTADPRRLECRIR
jgi:hypothetical protein